MFHPLPASQLTESIFAERAVDKKLPTFHPVSLYDVMIKRPDAGLEEFDPPIGGKSNVFSIGNFISGLWSPKEPCARGG